MPLSDSTPATILVVEDERLVGLDIVRTLNKFGYETVGPVATSEEARAAAAENNPDLILMDVMLAGDVDGITTAAAIRDSFDVPVIFLTAYADKTTIDRAKITDPAGYLVKPFNELELRAAIEINLARKSTNGRAKSFIREFLPAQNGTNGSSDGKPEDTLRSLSILRDLDASRISALADGSTVRSMKTGQSFMYDGTEICPAFVVKSGRVAVLKTSPEGKQLIVEVLGPGDLFGMMIAIEKTYAPLTVRAQRKTELLLIPRSTLMLALHDNGPLALQLTEYASQRLRASHDASLAIAYYEVPVRLAATLAALTQRFAYREDPQSPVLLDISRRELADITGSTVETVVRVLKQFEKLGLVKTGKRRVLEITDVDGLQNFAQQRKSEQAWEEVSSETA